MFPRLCYQLFDYKATLVAQTVNNPPKTVTTLLISYAVLCLVTQSCLTLCNTMDCTPPGSSVHGDSPGKNTGLGCHALLQGIFLTQGSNPCLLPWQVGSLPLAPPGKPSLPRTSSLMDPWPLLILTKLILKRTHTAWRPSQGCGPHHKSTPMSACT